VLFAAIERARRHVRAPRVHRVLVVDEFNASVCQVPRLGVLGWQKNFLLLGLPLLHALSPGQFQAVLAHEFGHLAGAHSRLGGWIYRVRAGWSRIAERMEQQKHWGSFLFLRFFRWYAPWFAAWSFVLARRQEVEADRDAAELAGAREAADALCSLKIRSSFLSESYWPGVYAAADREPRPHAAAPFTGLAQALRGGVRRDDAQAWLSAALEERTGVADTHPCLAERLAALEMQARVPPPLATSAADALLGAAAAPLASSFDEAWRQRAQDWWVQRHAHVQESRAGLAALDARAAQGPLAPAEAFEQAWLREELEGAGCAFPLYQSLLAREPAHTGARFAVGRLLLAQDDEAGLALLDEAMKQSEGAILPGCQLAWNFLVRHGREHEAERWRERYLAQRDRQERAQAERAALHLDGRYLAHGLEGEALERLRAALAAHPKVRRAWLVRRDLEFRPERPLFALGVKQKWSLARQKQRDLALQQELVDSLPLPAGDNFVLVLNHRRRKERVLFTRVAGSRIL
jgi:Zn-dependent protease with chaperone function